MLITLLIFSLVSNAVIPRRDKSILFNRIIISSLSLTAFLAYCNLHVTSLSELMDLLYWEYNRPLTPIIMSFCVVLISAVNRTLTIQSIVFYSAHFSILYHRYYCTYDIDFRVIVLPVSFVIVNLIIYKLYILFTEDKKSSYRALLVGIFIAIKPIFLLLPYIFNYGELTWVCSIVELNNDDKYCELRSRSGSCIKVIRSKHSDFLAGNISWADMSSDKRKHLLFWYDRLVAIELKRANRAIDLGHLKRSYEPTLAHNFVLSLENKLPKLPRV